MPQVDTHYPNLVKIEADLQFSHTHKHIGPVFSPAEEIFHALHDAAVCIFSDITQETEVSSLPLSER